MLQSLKIVSIMAAAASGQVAVIDSQSPLVPMRDYVPPGDLDSNPGFFYPADYRVLNCWECFQSQGKMCIDKAQGQLFQFTSSSDPGRAFCCKPDINTGFCESGSEHTRESQTITTICSQPSYGVSDSKYSNVLTDNRNHQMFAFCPHVSKEKCGIPNGQPDSDSGHLLNASLSEQTISSKEMRYRRPTRENQGIEREYDACYYEIVPDQGLYTEYNPKFINFKLT